jgi:hypothetical protein
LFEQELGDGVRRHASFGLQHTGGDGGRRQAAHGHAGRQPGGGCSPHGARLSGPRGTDDTRHRVAVEGHGSHRSWLILAQPGARDRSADGIRVGEAAARIAAGGGDVDDLLLYGQGGVGGVTDGAVAFEH